MTHWIRFALADGSEGFGTLEGERIAEYHGDMFGTPQASGRTYALAELRLLSPCSPSKVIALWNNYHQLAARLEKAPPAHPLFMILPSTSVTGTGEAIRRPPGYAGKIVIEGELGVVIGRTCRNVSELEAGAYIFGYTCINDVTAIEILTEDTNFPQWGRSKSFDTFTCVGPAIASQIDLATASVVTTLDGVERQNYPLSDMIFTPAQIVSRLSADLTLCPGDVIACGTSVGVGSMKNGARISIAISGIGELNNHLQA